MESKNTKKEFEEKIIAKALKDEKFRQELYRNPKGCLEKEFGISIPGSTVINVVEEKEGEVCIVLPAMENQEGELTEKDMESVAGGWSGYDCYGTGCADCGGTN
jgi:hypothetical protein